MQNTTPTYEQLLAENATLREENKALRQKLGLDIDTQSQSTTNQEPIPASKPSDIPNPFPNATVTRKSKPDEKISLFMSLFRGREDVYAKRWFSVKHNRGSYSPVCLNEWVQGVCNKGQGKNKCNRCPNRNLAKLSRNAIFAHLSGKHATGGDVIGVYPLTEDEHCYFLAIDFDDDNWQHDITAFRNTCRELGLTAYIERSRSSNGGHAWFFFEDKIPAVIARKFGSVLLTESMSCNHAIKFESYDRLFPNQDIMPKGGFGNLIALPLQGQAVREKQSSVFVDDNFIPFHDQWAFLSCVTKLNIEIVEDYIKRFCKNSELGILYSAGKESDDTGQKPWEKSKPQQELAALDFSETVKIVKANMLHIDKSGITSTALNRIKRLGAFRNPDFYKSQAMRLPTYDKPRIIDTTMETSQYLSIPRGCEDELLALLDSAKVQYIIDDKRNIGIPINAEFNGVLRDEQELAVNAMLRHETGILSATTAFGKTVIGAYIISQRKVNTLILVHTSALLEQWKKSLSQFLEINESLPEQSEKRGRRKEVSIIGQLGSAKNTLRGKIDIAIMQSLTPKGENDDVKELVKDYGLVIVDECHHVSAESFEKILKAVNAKYVYGLTATPKRQNGHHPIIVMQCGAIRYQVDAKEQAKNSGFERFIVPRFTSFKKPVGMEDKDFGITRIYATIAENELRNKLIVSDIVTAVEKGRTPIVLTQRSIHVELLANILERSIPNVIRLIGKASVKEKRDVLERLRAIPKDEKFVIVATGKYVGEGFDEPRLDTLFLAAPISWKGTLQQYAGRLHREYDGKKSVIIYDYVDIHLKMLENMYHKRVSGYSGMGYKALSLSNTESQEKVGIIFDSRNFMATFERDVQSAKREIIICSSVMQKSRVTKIMELLSAAKINGVRVVVITRPVDEYDEKEQSKVSALTELLSKLDVSVILKPNIHHKFAVIDENIVWYGSVSVLGFSYGEESIVRFENAEVAGELLSAVE